MRFQLTPKSMTLDNLEWLKRTLAEKVRFHNFWQTYSTGNLQQKDV